MHPAEPLPDLPPGARQMAARLGLTLPELAQALRCGPDALTELASHLEDVFGSLETGRLWLRTPNPLLAGEAPVQFLLSGDAEAIRRLLRMAESGMPT